MASNFQADVTQQNSSSLQLRLRGDFDGDSAYQLLNLINDNGNSLRKITLDTDALKSLNLFGTDLFRTYAKSLQRQGLDIVFTGKAKSAFEIEQAFD